MTKDQGQLTTTNAVLYNECPKQRRLAPTGRTHLPMLNVQVFCFLASYVIAFGLELTRLVKSAALWRAGAMLLGAVGLFAHTWYLMARFNETSLPPLLSSTHDWLLVLSWLAILFYLFLSVLDRQLPVGLFLLPLVLLLIVAAYFVSDSPNQMVTAAVRGWTMLHVSLLVFGMVGVLLGFVLSMMYLVQHHRLKQKQSVHEGLSLPSLARLSRLNWWAVVISVPLLTAGVFAGIVLNFFHQGGDVRIAWSDPVVILNGAVIVLMLAFLVWLTRQEHHTGKQVAWRTVWAFGFLLVMLIGLQVLTGRGLLESGHTAISPSPALGREAKYDL